MTEFTIRLADERGRIQEQTHAAATAEELRARFTRPATTSTRSSRAPASPAGSKKKVKLETFLVFNQQFLTLIRAGLPILSSLELLAKRQKNPIFRAQLEDVAARVKTGESISAAFEAQGGFPLVYTTTLLAGERSGNLEEVLQRYLDFQRVSLTFRKKLKASLDLSRPPHRHGDRPLHLPHHLRRPAVRQALRPARHQAPRAHAPASAPRQRRAALRHLYGPALALIVYLIVRWTRTDSGANFVDRVRIGTPGLGQVWLKYQVGLFSRTLSTLLTGGLPLVPSLETAARSIESRKIAKAVFTSVESVREGQGLATSLEETGVFPELSVEMIEVGESTGALPAMLNSVAEFFEEDVQTQLAAIMSLIEP